mmetsp:Transcript_24650/g.41667  ORF Transcript_24650/g.41667 Transcript_24650/m.41667 type:complete len:335 (-) Transcript_24650:2692-3696(-)
MVPITDERACSGVVSLIIRLIISLIVRLVIRLVIRLVVRAICDLLRVVVLILVLQQFRWSLVGRFKSLSIEVKVLTSFQSLVGSVVLPVAVMAGRVTHGRHAKHPPLHIVLHDLRRPLAGVVAIPIVDALVVVIEHCPELMILTTSPRMHLIPTGMTKELVTYSALNTSFIALAIVAHRSRNQVQQVLRHSPANLSREFIVKEPLPAVVVHKLLPLPLLLSKSHIEVCSPLVSTEQCLDLVHRSILCLDAESNRLIALEFQFLKFQSGFTRAPHFREDRGRPSSVCIFLPDVFDNGCHFYHCFFHSPAILNLSNSIVNRLFSVPHKRFCEFQTL